MHLNVECKKNPSRETAGRRTAAGLERSRHSATRYGLTGTEVAIGGEDPAEYDALRKSLVEEQRPVTEEEAMLIETIAENWWKIGRARRCERDFFERSINGDIYSSESFRNFVRYRAGVENAWNDARRELATIRADNARQFASENRTGTLV